MQKRSDLLESTRNLTIENGLYLRYINDRETGKKPDASAIEHIIGQHERIKGELWRAAAPDGGILVIVETFGNGESNVRIYGFETLYNDFRNRYDEHSLPMRSLLERLMIARNRLFMADAARCFPSQAETTAEVL